MRAPGLPRGRAAAVVAALAVVVLTGCDQSSPLDEVSSPEDGGSSSSNEQQVDTPVEAPENGLCRVLDVEAISQPSDDTEPVDCREDHTAETFHVGELPDDAEYDDPALAGLVYDECQQRWAKFTGADASLTLRSIVSWAWFRPSESAWDDGARWFRCDVVAGEERPDGLVPLPETAKGVLLGIPPDRWLACVDAEAVQDAPYLSCEDPHSWRAVSTIVVSEKEKYPGDRLVEVLSRDFCSDSVLAWLDYPPQYDYGYTWFGEAEWEAGNNRAVCWARTTE